MDLNQRVCKFPVAALTHDREHGDLKQQNFILTQFLRPGVENQCPWAQIKVLAGDF